MKKQYLILLFILLGIILTSLSFISHKDQAINLDDTYFVISSSDFALFLLVLFSIPAFISFVIQKFISQKILLIQLLFFSLPIIYFMIYDIVTPQYSPGFYFAHPFIFHLLTVYLPIGFLAVFLTSILFIIFNSIYSIMSYIKSK